MWETGLRWSVRGTGLSSWVTISIITNLPSKLPTRPWVRGTLGGCSQAPTSSWLVGRQS